MCVEREDVKIEEKAHSFPALLLYGFFSIYHHSYGFCMTVDIGRHNVYTETKFGREQEQIKHEILKKQPRGCYIQISMKDMVYRVRFHTIASVFAER